MIESAGGVRGRGKRWRRGEESRGREGIESGKKVHVIQTRVSRSSASGVGFVVSPPRDICSDSFLCSSVAKRGP